MTAQILPFRGSRGPSTLIRVTYADISEWSGVSIPVVRRYASEGRFDSRDLDSVLQWVNGRRLRRGWRTIGGGCR